MSHARDTKCKTRVSSTEQKAWKVFEQVIRDSRLENGKQECFISFSVAIVVVK